jgi:transcriptional regulator with XRE-family HTH domain
MSQKTLREKTKKLFYLLDCSQSEFARRAKVPVSTLHEFLFKDKNIAYKSYLQILSSLGIDLEETLNERLQQLLKQTPIKSSGQELEDEDVLMLINRLSQPERRELLKTAINLHKIKRTPTVREAVQRMADRLK